MGIEEKEKEKTEKIISSSEDITCVLCKISIEEEKEEEEEEAEEEVDVEGVEKILGYRFCEPKLVIEAMTHPSYLYPIKPCISYERLEFIGDAVLNCITAKEVFKCYPDLSPGPLTRLRAANVDTEKLARVAVRLGLYRFLRHKSPQLPSQIIEFMHDIAEYPVHSHGLVDAPKVLADIVESTIGAVFIDTGYSLEATWKVFQGLIQPFIGPDTVGKHPVTELQEQCQKMRMRLRFVKDMWKENTRVEVLVDERLMGSAMYAQKKEIALNRAAKDALDNLKTLLVDHNTVDDLENPV